MFYKIVLLLFLFAIPAGADFFPQTDDIPLMNHMTLQEKNTVTFDTPAGQILSYTTKSTYQPATVRSFYHDSLTSLGWVKESQDTYTRGSDRFQMTFFKDGHIKFDITLSSTN